MLSSLKTISNHAGRALAVSAFTLLFAGAGCATKVASTNKSLDGQFVVVDGTWSQSAEGGPRILTEGEPKVIHVVNVGHIAVPHPDQRVRVSGTLHRRVGAPEQPAGESGGEPTAGTPAGYTINWPDVRWQALQ